MKKKWIAVLLTVAMTGSMAACGSGSGAKSGSGDKDEAKEQTVELWTCWTDGADTAKAGEEQIKKFEEQTGIKVNQTNFTYDMLHEKILTAAAGGNVPDLIWGLPEYIGEFYNMGILEDLTERFNDWEDKDALSEAVVKAMTIDDKIVGIPYEMTVRAYLTHTEDLKAAGIEVPKTWEDLLSNGGYYEKNGKYLTELACTGVRSAQELLVYLAQYDLEIASAQDDGKYKNTWKDNDEEMEKATKVFQMYQDLVDKKIIDENCKNWGWEETDENFATGITSTYVTGNWLAERETSIRIQWKMLQFLLSHIRQTGIRLLIWNVNHYLFWQTAKIKTLHLNWQQLCAVRNGRKPASRIALHVLMFLRTVSGAKISRLWQIQELRFLQLL